MNSEWSNELTEFFVEDYKWLRICSHSYFTHELGFIDFFLRCRHGLYLSLQVSRDSYYAFSPSCSDLCNVSGVNCDEQACEV